jgi:YHS domain-containing protein
MKDKIYSFRVDPVLDERIQQEAKQYKISISEMWRRIGWYYFSSTFRKIFK